MESSVSHTAATNLPSTTQDWPETSDPYAEQSSARDDVHAQLIKLVNKADSEGVLTKEEKEGFAQARERELSETVTLDQSWINIMQAKAQELVKEVKDLTKNFLDKIDMAQQAGWITKASADKWRDRLAKRAVNWEQTRLFLGDFKESYIDNWKQLHDDKESLKDQSEKLKVTGKQVHELKLLKDKKFDDKPYASKRSAVDKAWAALKVYEVSDEITTTLYKRADKILTEAVAIEALGEHEVGRRLQDLFGAKQSNQKLTKLIDVLEKEVGEWAKWSYRYDRAHRVMEDQGVPQGFTPKEKVIWLAGSFSERKEYVENLESYLELVAQGYPRNKFERLKLEIRNSIATQDWGYAQTTINEARSVAVSNEDHAELDSMERNVKRFLKEEEKQELSKDAQFERAKETQDWMHTVLAEVPPSVQPLYLEALQAGPQVFSSLTRYFYNRVWCTDHGYLDESKEKKLYEDSKKDTEDIMENGHRRFGLENINLDQIEDDEKNKAMRPYQKTWAPTLLHMDATQGGSRSALINELKGKDGARDYWTTLVVTNITNAKNDYLVKKVNWKLRSGIRELNQLGYGFSLTDTPRKGAVK